MSQINAIPKFRNKNGDLTPYAFACGYIQFASLDGTELSHWENGKQLYLDGRVYNFKHYQNGECIAWLTFDTLTEARAHYHDTSVVDPRIKLENELYDFLYRD